MKLLNVFKWRFADIDNDYNTKYINSIGISSSTQYIIWVNLNKFKTN